MPPERGLVMLGDTYMLTISSLKGTTTIVTWLQGCGWGATIHPLLQDIATCLMGYASLAIRHVFREANMVAD